jgi:DNA-binding Xre family transcriptional regulator
MTVGSNIKIDAKKLHTKILEKHKNVYQFCKAAGIDQVTISNLMTGRTTKIRSETVVKISEFLGCLHNDLLLEDGPPVVVDAEPETVVTTE